MTPSGGLPLSGHAPVATLSFTSIVQTSGLGHQLHLHLLITAIIGDAPVVKLCNKPHPIPLGTSASVGRGLTLHPIYISHRIHVESRAGTLFRRRGIFALMFVSCNAILVHVLLAKHLLLPVCALVARLLLQLAVLTTKIFLHAANNVRSFFNVAAIAVNKFVISVPVILAVFQWMPLAFAVKCPRLFFVGTWL